MAAPAEASTVEAGTTDGWPRPRAALPALCVTQVTCWGILYYAFPVLRADLVADTGWSSPAATAAFSAALVLSAVAGIVVGRTIDRRGPRLVMTGGVGVGAVGLTVLASSPNLVVFTVGWLVTGLAMSSTFYQPAFAALTRWYREGRVRALTTVTLAGGLASTVFAPITAVLTESLGWRRAVLVLVAILLVVAAPLHWLALRGPWPAHPDDAGVAGPSSRPTVATTRPFLLLAAGLTLSGFAMYAVVFGLVPLLTERGLDVTTAAWALGLGGAGQTLGRLLYGPLSARTGVTTRTTALVLAGGVTTALLAVVPGPVPLLVAVAVLAGMVRGNLTLIGATAVTDRWGTASYGRLSAVLAAPVTAAAALAPWAGAALAPVAGGQAALFAWLAGLSVVAALLVARSRDGSVAASAVASPGDADRRRSADLRRRWWPGAGSNRRPSDFQSDARTN